MKNLINVSIVAIAVCAILFTSLFFYNDIQSKKEIRAIEKVKQEQINKHNVEVQLEKNRIYSLTYDDFFQEFYMPILNNTKNKMIEEGMQIDSYAWTKTILQSIEEHKSDWKEFRKQIVDNIK